MDFEFCALLACSIFGWTVAEVFDLTFPQFASVLGTGKDDSGDEDPEKKMTFPSQMGQ